MPKKKSVPEEPISLMARLKRHHIFRVASGYAVLAYVLVLVANAAFPDIGLSRADVRYIIAALALLFPVALVLGWMFIPPSKQNLDQFSNWQQLRFRLGSVLAVVIVLIVTLSGIYLWHANERYIKLKAVSKHAVTTQAPAETTVIPAKSIAVLPFENLSTDKANAYFATGMQDMILAKLTQIGDLKVISRTSTQQYASHPQNLTQVGAQLGVATILEGSVQKAGNQVLINLQLIDARSDNHIWAEVYQRTLNNIFGVEGEVAQQVADALKLKLTGTEQRDLANIPTHNPAAYDAYLKAETLANQAVDSENAGVFSTAISNYQRAISLDPDFALAYARLAYVQLFGYWVSVGRNHSLLTSAKAAADRALALNPNLPQAYVALGYYYYWGFFRYGKAIDEFQHALRLSPKNILALTGLAYVWRRQGKFEQALTAFQQILPMAPRDQQLLDEYGDTYARLRRYPQAQQLLEQSLAIDPDYSDAKDVLVQILLFGFGNVPAARAVITPPPVWRVVGAGLPELYGVVGIRAYPDLFDRKFDAAYNDLDSAPTGTSEQRLYRDVARIAIRVVAGQRGSVQTECREAKKLLDARLAMQPDSIIDLVKASWVDVCLGRDSDAIAAARHAAHLVPVSRDAYAGPLFLTGLAQIEAHAGEPDKAIRLIRKLLVMPVGDAVSIERFKLDPVWDPLRKNPRFQALLKKYRNDSPDKATANGG